VTLAPFFAFYKLAGMAWPETHGPFWAAGTGWVKDDVGLMAGSSVRLALAAPAARKRGSAVGCYRHWLACQPGSAIFITAAATPEIGGRTNPPQKGVMRSLCPPRNGLGLMLVEREEGTPHPIEGSSLKPRKPQGKTGGAVCTKEDCPWPYRTTDNGRAGRCRRRKKNARRLCGSLRDNLVIKRPGSPQQQKDTSRPPGGDGLDPATPSFIRMAFVGLGGPRKRLFVGNAPKVVFVIKRALVIVSLLGSGSRPPSRFQGVVHEGTR